MMRRTQNKQQGVVLIFSLGILVVLTLIGISSMQGTQSQLAMAGNQREYLLMLNTAELALQTGENFINNNPTSNFNNAALGLSSLVGQEDNANFTPVDYFDAATWGPAASQAATTIFNTANPRYDDPRFIIEYLGDRVQQQNRSLDIGAGVGGGYRGDTVAIFRVTARGTGIRGSSFRYVQSYFGLLKP